MKHSGGSEGIRHILPIQKGLMACCAMVSGDVEFETGYPHGRELTETFVRDLMI